MSSTQLSAMALSAYTFPRFIALRSNDDDYLGYIDNKNHSGYLKFSETEPGSPYIKFEVEISGKSGLVHIRSCLNNKYWERTKNLSITGKEKEQYWITATAQKKEEDQSKESCTLFKPISVDTGAKTIRIMHVQSGCYLCLWRSGNPSRCVLSNYAEYDSNKCDIFKVTDWQSFLILPKYVAFKGSNDLYACVHVIRKFPFLDFETDDIGEPTATFEILTTHQGYLRIKDFSDGKLWQISSTLWILANGGSGDTTTKTLYRPIKVGNKKIALICLANNCFCRIVPVGDRYVTHCLNANGTSATKEAQLTVEEAVVTREIYDFKYDAKGSRVYDEQPIVLTTNYSTNLTQKATTLDVKLTYTDTKTSIWNSKFSIKLAAKGTFDANIPYISGGNVEVSAEIQTGVEWEKLNTHATALEIIHKATVPPMTKVTVNMIATKGYCDVPFKYIQRDVLYTGETVLTEVNGGTYTGSNYFNIAFQTKEEKITA